MILIADSSALIALTHCGQLEILEKLFGEVKVPENQNLKQIHLKIIYLKK